MARRRRSNASSTSAPPVSPEARALERIGRLLAVIATKGLNLTEQIGLLDAAGYSVQDIADITRATPNHVSVALYGMRRKKKK